MATRQGFTLVEILIVVIILGILAAIVVPQVSTAGTAARISMLADSTRSMRVQICHFKWQHNGVAPGYPGCNNANAPDADTFITQMTTSTTAVGAVPGVGERGYGPYMTKMPENPVNGLSTVQIVLAGDDMPVVADDSHGWSYKPSTIEFQADCTGTDQSGNPLIDF